jgi:collagenase-like PrtC family protease
MGVAAGSDTGGADSVYSGEKLNMKPVHPNNFTTADLPEIVALCREKGLKSTSRLILWFMMRRPLR